jgi:hypothetical protein
MWKVDWRVFFWLLVLSGMFWSCVLVSQRHSALKPTELLGAENEDTLMIDSALQHSRGEMRSDFRSPASTATSACFRFPNDLKRQQNDRSRWSRDGEASDMGIPEVGALVFVGRPESEAIRRIYGDRAALKSSFL